MHRASSYSLSLPLLPSFTLAVCKDCLVLQYLVTKYMNGIVATLSWFTCHTSKLLNHHCLIHMRRSNNNREWRQHHQQFQRRNSLLRNLWGSMISRCWADIGEPIGNLVFTA